MTADPPGMGAALAEFLGELARTHGSDRAHPAIQVLEAVVGALGDAVNPAIANAVNLPIADHYPVAAAADELAAVIAHAGDLVMAYRAGG